MITLVYINSCLFCKYESCNNYLIASTYEIAFT